MHGVVTITKLSPVRVLVYLVVSGTAHLLAARWLLAVSPWARARRRRVLGVALGLSTLAALFRALSWIIPGAFLRSLTAAATIELATVMIGGLFAGAFMLVTRVLERGVRAMAPGPKAEAAPNVSPHVSRREAIERLAGAAAFGGSGLALGWGLVRGRHEFEVEEVVVRVAGWPKALEGYVIAQVSDVHVGPFVGDRELDEGFELVRRVRPDLVVATGDLVDFESSPIRHLARRMLTAPARVGAFSILGNHDHYAGAADVVSLAREGGLRILCNEALVIRGGDGGGFALVGVDDLHGRSGRSPGFGGPDLGRATSALDPSLPRILLAHQPNYFREAAGRVALQLSGHTHGGQINPGFRPADLFMEFVHGRYERQGSTLWVNRGFGVAGPPTRVMAPPEITKLVIVAA